jgi:hypothetical protein
MTSKVKGLSHMLTGHLEIYFGDMSFQVTCPFAYFVTCLLEVCVCVCVCVLPTLVMSPLYICGTGIFSHIIVSLTLLITCDDPGVLHFNELQCTLVRLWQMLWGSVS